MNLIIRLYVARSIKNLNPALHALHDINGFQKGKENLKNNAVVESKLDPASFFLVRGLICPFDSKISFLIF